MPTDTVALPPPTITLQSSPLFSDTAMSEYASKVALDQCFGLLSLLADIRKAAGDPTGKLMQDELVAHIAAMRAANALLVRWKGEIDSWRIAAGLEFPEDYDNSPRYAVSTLVEHHKAAK